MNTNNQIVQVKVEDIVPNRNQPRIKFNNEELNELSDSIKQYGIIQPLILRPFGNKYEIIAGERRYRAAIISGLKTVPALIINVNDETSAELALIENIQRKNLNAIEEAKTYKRILDISNITQEELAKKLGKSQATIANKIRLLNLDQEVQNAVLENKISERHARALLQLNNLKSQKEILNKIITEKLTVKLTEDLILNNYKSIESEKERIIGDEIKMNEQNYNMLNSQPAQTIPETPLPQTPTQQPQNNSIFNNNFFPSLEDEKTNMGLNPWEVPNQTNTMSAGNNTSQPFTMPNNMEQSPIVNPWEAPVSNNDGITNLNNEQSLITPTTNGNPINFGTQQPEQNQLPQFDIGTNNNFVGPESASVSTPEVSPQPVSSMPQSDLATNNNFVSPEPANISTPEVQPQPTSSMPQFDIGTNNNFVSPNPQATTSMNNVNIPTFNQQTPGFIDQSVIETQSNQITVPNNTINDYASRVRKAISEIDPTGTKLQTSEVDLDTEYQIIIKISKESN